MKMTKKAITLSLGLVVMGSATFAQSLADAKKAIDAEQYQKATTMLKALVKSAAKAENFYSLGDVYLQRDYLDSARAAFTQGVTADPKSPLNYVGLGHADLVGNNATSAKTNFDKAIEVASKKDYVPYLYIGKSYLALDKPNFAAALPNLQKADELDDKDKDPETFLALGDYFALQRKNSEALGKYMQALSVDQTLKRPTVQIGRMYKESRAFTDAETELKNVVAADANYGPAYRELAELYMQWANQEPQNFAAKAAEALTSYKKYLDLTDNSYESRLRYAQFLFYAKDFQTLQKETSELAAMNQVGGSNSLIIARLRGYSAYENKNYPQSLQYMNEFFAAVKDTSRIISDDYLYLGKAQMQAKDDSLALKNIMKAVTMDSTKVEALAEVAQSFYDAKDYKKAASTYEIVNRLNPNGKGSGYNLFNEGRAAYFYYGEGYTNKTNPSKDLLVKADTAFARLARQSPGTLEAYLWRARVNNFLDDGKDQTGAKLPYYQKFLDSAEARVAKGSTPAPSPKMMIEAYNNIAGFAAYKDDKEKAKLYWDKALALEPTNATALAGVKSLSAPTASAKAPVKKK